jgi:hypothetical protein
LDLTLYASVISSQVIPSNNKVAIKIAIANLSIVKIP